MVRFEDDRVGEGGNKMRRARSREQQLGSGDDGGINAVFLENYWNDGSPQPQKRYFGKFIVSIQRIGC